MNIQKFLSDFQELQYKIVGDNIIDLNFASILINNKDRSDFRNYALLKEFISNEELEVIEGILESHKREKVLCLDPSVANQASSFLIQKHYRKEWEDSWMFYTEKVEWANDFINIKSVKTEEDLKTFLDTLDRCYTDDDPKNPYGRNSKEYLDMMANVWRKDKTSGKVEHFTLFYKSKPAAVITLMNYKDIGYISNTGSLLEFRGMGFGKTISLFAVYKSIHNGNSIHCLTTEKGHYPYDFYKYIGFKDKFTAISLSKKQI